MEAPRRGQISITQVLRGTIPCHTLEARDYTYDAGLTLMTISDTNSQSQALDLCMPIAPNNGRTTCSGPATFTAVGGNQAEGDGALFSKYPALAGGSIRGGTFGTVAVQDGFLGLTTRQLRMYGTQIFITPSNQGLISQYGGPTGPLSVSDYGDANIQATSGVAFDLYRFPTVSAGMQFGRQTMNTTISYPNNSGASCPAGYTVVP